MVNWRGKVVSGSVGRPAELRQTRNGRAPRRKITNSERGIIVLIIFRLKIQGVY
jgi:hypothetical protein